MIASYYRSRINCWQPRRAASTFCIWFYNLTLPLPSKWRTSQPTGIPLVFVFYRTRTWFASTNAQMFPITQLGPRVIPSLLLLKTSPQNSTAAMGRFKWV